MKKTEKIQKIKEIEKGGWFDFELQQFREFILTFITAITSIQHILLLIFLLNWFVVVWCILSSKLAQPSCKIHQQVPNSFSV